MARRMSYSLTNLSHSESDAGAGLQTMVGMPAFLAYSKALRTLPSLLTMVMTPQLMGIRPASVNFFTPAWSCSGEPLRGRCMSLMETYLRPTRVMALMQSSTFILRREYEATPTFRPRRELGFAVAASWAKRGREAAAAAVKEAD